MLLSMSGKMSEHGRQKGDCSICSAPPWGSISRSWQESAEQCLTSSDSRLGMFLLTDLDNSDWRFLSERKRLLYQMIYWAFILLVL